MPARKRIIKIKPQRLIWIMEHYPKNDYSMEIDNAPDSITRKELSEITYMSEKTIQVARTKGNITPDSLEIICKQLDVSPDYLTGVNDMDLRARFEKLEDKYSSLDNGDYTEYESIKELISWYRDLKACNRIDNDFIYVKHYGQTDSRGLQVADIATFLETFMNSRYFHLSGKKIPLELVQYADLQPYLLEYIPVLSESIYTFITNKKKEKR